jgi:ribosomal protein S18 acetylase RimI-like enzyme
MSEVIRAMTEQDRDAVLEMMRIFYTSPAVWSNGSEEIFRADVDACVSGSPYLEGYVFAEGDDVLGYAMLAKSFSTEFGKPCIWIEDLFVRDGYRDRGIGSRFLRFVAEIYPDAVLRLEVEEDNERAVHVYRKFGFDVLPYVEMKK